MTFETTIAAASSGPSRAWSAAGAVERDGPLVECAVFAMVAPLAFAGGAGGDQRFFIVTANRPKKTVSSWGSAVTALT